MRRAIPTVLVVPLLWAGCEPAGEMEADGEAAPELSSAEAPDAAAVEAEVARIRDAWVQGADADDAAAVAALYGEDAVLVDVDGSVTEGREAIQEALTEDFQALSELSVSPTETEVGRDLVTELGEFTQTVETPGGESQTMTGRYLVVLRRQADGSWKLVQHVASIPFLAEGEGEGM